MHFEGTFDVRAPKEKVYALLLDPQQISECMPELQKLDVKSPDDYTVTVRAGVSFIKGDFTLHFTVAEKVSPTHARLTAHGTGIGSTVDMETTMDVSDAQGGGSAMRWMADAKVGGKVASLGQRLLDGQAERIIKQLFECLRHKLEVV